MNIALIALASLLAGPAPQEPQTEKIPQKQGWVSEAEVKLHYFQPQHLSVDKLEHLALRLYGNEVLVAPKGGPPRKVQRFHDLGRTLLVYDTPSQAERYIAALDELDRLGAQDESEAEPEPVTFEYRPRHVELGELLGLLHGMPLAVHMTELRVPGGPGLLIVTGAPEDVELVRRWAELVDVPATQVTLTVHLIRGIDEGASSPGLPQELTGHLARLLPMQGFELLSTAMLRSASTARSIEVESSAGGGITYRLSLQPAAYDEDAEQLTFSVVSFQLMQSSPPAGGGTAVQPGFPATLRQSFQTSLSMKAGEYAVLGAVGEEPIFVVLRMSTGG